MSEIKPVDLSSLPTPPKRGRGRPKGSTKKKKQEQPEEQKSSWNPFANEISKEEKEAQERKDLEEKLLNMSDHNPDVVLKPVNNKIASTVREMDIEELRARVRMGRKIHSAKLDNHVGGQVIFLANETVGRFLDCVEELHKSTENDRLLQETTTEFLSLKILDWVPMELKLAGLYSSHVIKSYYEAVKTTKSKTATNEEKQSAINNFKDKLIAIKEGLKNTNEVGNQEENRSNEAHQEGNRQQTI